MSCSLKPSASIRPLCEKGLAKPSQAFNYLKMLFNSELALLLKPWADSVGDYCILSTVQSQWKKGFQELIPSNLAWLSQTQLCRTASTQLVLFCSPRICWCFCKWFFMHFIPGTVYTSPNSSFSHPRWITQFQTRQGSNIKKKKKKKNHH